MTTSMEMRRQQRAYPTVAEQLMSNWNEVLPELEPTFSTSDRAGFGKLAPCWTSNYRSGVFGVLSKKPSPNEAKRDASTRKITSPTVPIRHRKQSTTSTTSPLPPDNGNTISPTKPSKQSHYPTSLRITTPSRPWLNSSGEKPHRDIFAQHLEDIDGCTSPAINQTDEEIMFVEREKYLGIQVNLLRNSERNRNTSWVPMEW